MRVATLSYKDGNGGAAIAAMRLAKSLEKFKEINNSFLCVDKTTDIPIVSQYGSKYNFYLDRLHFFPYEKSVSERYKFSPSFHGSDVTKSEIVKSSDIIHLHWINHGFMSIENIGQLSSLNIPIVWTLHDMWAFTGGCHYSENCFNFKMKCGNCKFLKRGHKDDLSYKLWEKKQKAYENLDLTIVTCSNWLKQEALSSSLFCKSKVVNIQNPIDSDIYRKIDRSEAKRKLGLELSSRYILFVAAKVSDTRKGIDLIIESLRDLKTKNCKLLVVGADPDASLFEEIDMPIVTLGSLNEQSMILAYNAADVFVIPSRQDNLPNTILESLCCGTPAVGFDIGGIGEMIKHKKNGYLAKPFHTKDLCNGIEWVIEADLGRDKIIEDLLGSNSSKTIASQYYELYESVIK